MEPPGRSRSRRCTAFHARNHRGQSHRRVRLHGPNQAFVNGKPYLYLANFSKGRIDVYDNTFNRVNLSPNRSGAGSLNSSSMFSENSFVDHELPPLFVPFGVHAIGNDVVVTYVLHEPSSPLETDGPGMGFVDIYNSEGRLLQRLEHGDWLNAPWGVTLAPLDFGRFSHDLLIGPVCGRRRHPVQRFHRCLRPCDGKIGWTATRRERKASGHQWHLVAQFWQCKPGQQECRE